MSFRNTFRSLLGITALVGPVGLGTRSQMAYEKQKELFVKEEKQKMPPPGTKIFHFYVADVLVFQCHAINKKNAERKWKTFQIEKMGLPKEGGVFNL